MPAAARFIWKIHESQRFEQVRAAMEKVGAPPYARQALFAFDVSGFMLNPQGITPETAAAQNAGIEKRLGAQGTEKLKKYLRNYYRLNAAVMREAYSLGIINDRVWQSRIEPNLDNYVPFMVLEYFTGSATAKMFRRHGTSKDILPAHLGGMLKSLAFIRRMQWQRMALNLKEFYQVTGRGLFDHEMTVRDDLTPQEESAIKQRGGGMVGFWENGNWRHMVFEDSAAADAVEHLQMEGAARQIFDLARKNSNFWRLIFTTYNIGFTIRNAIRTIRSLAEATGLRGLSAAQHSARVARDYVRAAQGGEWTPEIRELVQRGVLPPPEKAIRADLTEDDLTSLILSGAITPQQMTRGLPGDPVDRALHSKKFLKPLAWIADQLASASAFVESLPKIAADAAWQSKGLKKEEAAALARLEGIPNPGVRAGKYGPVMDQILMFYRVAIQGMRRSRTLLMHPKTRGAYALRLALSYGMIKSFYVLAGAGIIDALFGGDQDDWEEWIKRTTPYKFEQDDVLFLGWLDGSGRYRLPFGNKDIPVDWTPISLRIPSGEEGRHLAPLTANAITTLSGSDFRPVDPVQRLIEAGENMIPDANPTFGLAANLMDIGKPVPPQDDWRGRPIVTEDEWNAGYASRIWGMTKHAAATANLDFARQDVIANKGLPPWMQVVKSTPVAGTALNALLAMDNYAGVREAQRVSAEKASVAAKARLMRGRATVHALRQLDILQDKGAGNRTPVQEAQFQRLKAWHRQYYEGTKKNPGLFPVLKAKAAGLPNVDADFARKRLDETAREAMGAF